MIKTFKGKIGDISLSRTISSGCKGWVYMNQKDIARKYGVSRSTINSIVNNYNWKV